MVHFNTPHSREKAKGDERTRGAEELLGAIKLRTRRIPSSMDIPVTTVL
jgi:hypothetical protein